MKKLFIELFEKGFVAVSNAQRTEFTNAARAQGVHFSGGAYLFDEGAQIYYNDSSKEVRRLIGEMLLVGSVVVPRPLCHAFEQNIRACHGAALEAGCVYYINY